MEDPDNFVASSSPEPPAVASMSTSAMASNDEYELPIIPRNDSDQEACTRVATLPRTDGGREAWLVLGGCFMLEALVWGFPFAFGVFQNYYRSHEPFADDPSGIAAVSTTASGLMYISSPLVALFIQRFPQIRRPASFVGLVIAAVALVAASFAQNTATLLATQGVLYAVGGLTLYFPAMYVVDEWFVARKGLAYAVVWTGTGVSGAVVPFLLQWMLKTYGFRTALRVWAIVMVVIAAPSAYLMKNRFPISSSNRIRPVDLSFMKKAPFWFFEAGNIMASLAYFLPMLWIPSFAASQNFPSISGPLALCLLNVAACGGYLLQGMLVDRYHVTVAIFAATVGSVVAILVFWGLTQSPAMLCIFSIIWGLSGGGFAANWSGCAMAMRSSDRSLDTGLVIGFMCMGKGIASLIAGPISEQLLQATHRNGADFAYGTQYAGIIIFAGVTAMLGGTACVGRTLKML